VYLVENSIPLVLMRFVFRADSSVLMGSGHVMRCLAIAEEIASRGISVCLVGSLGGIEWVEKRFSSAGVQVIPEGSFYSEKKSDFLIIDSYRINPEEDFLTRNQWRAVVSIADRETPDFRPDLTIHPGLNGDWFSGEWSRFIYGARYIPIRKSTEKRVGLREGEFRKVVIFGGGTDPFKFAEAIRREISDNLNFKEAKIFSASLDRDFIGDQRFEIVPFGERLDLELSEADLVLTTASTSSLEVIAREIPVGVACAVQNQENCYNTLGAAGVAAQLGERISSGEWKFNASVINQLFNSPEYFRKLAHNSQSFIDFGGAARIVDEILKL
jgi:spore coat polysaccharide biosynthesis predicted glycosyltransferase SpsG